MTTVSSRASDRGQRLGVSAVIVAGGLALALVGCAKNVDPFARTGAIDDDYRVNHPITIEEQVEALDVPVSVAYATVNGTALAGSDYQQASGSLTFAANETTKPLRSS